MTDPTATLALRHYGRGHFALLGADERIDIDPRLPDGRGRAHAAHTLAQALGGGFVVLTQSDAPLLDDAAQVLDSGEVDVLSTPAVLDALDTRIDLTDLAEDLELWRTVRFAGVALQALPQPATGVLPGLPGMGGLPAPTQVLGDAASLLRQTLGAVPLMGDTLRRGPDLLQGMPLPTGAGARSRLSVHVTLSDGLRVLFVGDALGGPAPRRWLEDLASELDVDVLVAAVHGERVDGVVWAARELDPQQVVLYRDRDPYESGGTALPVRRFVEALQEDTPERSVVVLREGQELVFPSAPPASDPTEAPEASSLEGAVP